MIVQDGCFLHNVAHYWISVSDIVRLGMYNLAKTFALKEKTRFVAFSVSSETSFC